jgi:FHA domain
MSRLVIASLGAFFLVATILPSLESFTAMADSSSERLAIFKKPSVLRLGDCASGQYSSLLSFKLFHHGVNPDGSAYPFEIKRGLLTFQSDIVNDAIPRFEEVKRLLPHRLVVVSLLQSSEESGFPFWLIGVILVVLFLIIFLIVIAVIIFFIARRRSKKKQAAGPSSPGAEQNQLAPPSYSPSPTTSYAPAPAENPAPPPPAPQPAPQTAAEDQGTMIDLSRTIAITHDADTASINYGSIKFVSGALAGQQFEIKPDGEYVGRDGGSAQIVIPDPRISKRHLWIGVREGRVVIADQNSRNGTFVNDPKSARVTEASLNPGDTVILGESDVARFEFES